jgi:hypothetical protein
MGGLTGTERISDLLKILQKTYASDEMDRMYDCTYVQKYLPVVLSATFYVDPYMCAIYFSGPFLQNFATSLVSYKDLKGLPFL